MSALPIELGQTVLSDGRQGVVRFIGATAFANGEWVGLELSDDSGKNDGSVKGERYFDCQPGHGIFVRPESIREILQRPTPIANGRPGIKPVSGPSSKPRPSNGVLGDSARKRQSLAGSTSTPGSRLSVRVSCIVNLHLVLLTHASPLPSRQRNVLPPSLALQLQRLGPIHLPLLRERPTRASNLD